MTVSMKRVTVGAATYSEIAAGAAIKVIVRPETRESYRLAVAASAPAPDTNDCIVGTPGEVLTVEALASGQKLFALSSEPATFGVVAVS